MGTCLGSYFFLNSLVVSNIKPIVFVFFLLYIQSVSSQTAVHFRGLVTDWETGRPIEFANILNDKLKLIAVCDSEGHFNLELPAAQEHKIIVSHTSYIKVIVNMHSSIDTIINIRMQQSTIVLQETTISIDTRKATLNSELGRSEIRQSDILKLPSLLGSPDVLRPILNLPGVSKGNEGDGGLYVRGGEAGQNLFILDDIEIINPSHALGLYSVFNPFTTHKVSVFKESSPIYYDRKLSSVVVVQSISNDTCRFKGTVNVGNILSDIGIHGTTKNNRMNYSIGFRKTYLEIYSNVGNLVNSNESAEYLKSNMVGFYDLNGKITFRSGSTSQQNLSWYSGVDYINLNSKKAYLKTNINWRNRGIAFSTKHRFNENHTFESVISYTDYLFSFDGNVVAKNMTFQTDYSHLKFRAYYQYKTDAITCITGFNSTYYHLIPRNATVSSNLTETSNKDKFRAIENRLYGSLEFKPTENMMLYLGAQLKNFLAIGPYRYYNDDGSIAFNYSNNRLIESFIIPGISVSASYGLNSNSVLKASYIFDNQNIHQGVVSSIALPADFYVPTSRLIKPEYSHSFSSGITLNSVSGQDISVSIEAYYKSMQNLLLYQVNFNQTKTNVNIEDQFHAGDGWASGLELSLNKRTGIFTCNFSATLSKSRRRFDDFNNGNWFDSKYDRVGDIATSINYKLNQKLSINVNWVFTGGMKTTLPPGRMWMMGSIMNDFEDMNNVRLPSYHRLDMGMDIRLKQRYFQESILNISILNAYNRKNPFFVSYGIEAPQNDMYSIRIFAQQISLMPILPSISWKFIF